MTESSRREGGERRVFEEHPLFMRTLRLGDRLYAFVLVRFAVGLAIIAAAFFAERVVNIQGLNLPALCLLALVLLLCNMVTFAVVRPYHNHPERAYAARRFLALVMHFTITVDFLCLTIALWLVGGTQSPFQAFFLFHVIIASVLLSARAAVAYALFGYLLFAGMVLGTWTEWLPPYYPVGAIPSRGPLDWRYVWTVLLVQAILFVMIAVLLTYLMTLLRKGERQLVETNRELDRLSQQRRDFLNIALHNLRSPIAAASMLMSNLKAGYGGSLNEQQEQWASRSLERMKELLTFLNDLGSLAALESGGLDTETRTVDISELLQDLVNENQDIARAQGHRLGVELREVVQRVNGVPRLIREAVVNYITNAIKYTTEPGEIVVRALNRGAAVRIEVQDSGLGIPRAGQKRLFQEFARVHKDDPRGRNIPGSGLGLFIVQRIALAHHGRVGFTSTEGKGSTFFIEFPAAPES